jgi:hypothetical protein
MIYNLSINHEKEQAITRFKYLLDNDKKVELKVKHPKKSVSHNSYAHLLFSWFALEYGETMEYVKQEIFKKLVNPAIFKTEFVNEKSGEVREALRSFADLDSGETTIAIDKFRTWSSKEAGIYLPEPNDMAFLEEIEKQVNNSKYL